MRKVLDSLTEREREDLQYFSDIAISLSGAALTTCAIQFMFDLL